MNGYAVTRHVRCKPGGGGGGAWRGGGEGWVWEGVAGEGNVGGASKAETGKSWAEVTRQGQKREVTAGVGGG